MYVEDLCVVGLGRTRLAKSVQDAGWAAFTGMLETRRSGCATRRAFARVDRWLPSTRMCCDCGRINEKIALNVREWDCPCGRHHDRDINAAINIKAAGQADFNDRRAHVRPGLVPAARSEAVTHPGAACSTRSVEGISVLQLQGGEDVNGELAVHPCAADGGGRPPAVDQTGQQYPGGLDESEHGCRRRGEPGDLQLPWQVGPVRELVSVEDEELQRVVENIDRRGRAAGLAHEQLGVTDESQDRRHPRQQHESNAEQGDPRFVPVLVQGTSPPYGLTVDATSITHRRQLATQRLIITFHGEVGKFALLPLVRHRAHRPDKIPSPGR